MGSLAERQKEALTHLEAEYIPRGATFPLELIKKFLPPDKGDKGGMIIDAGCGLGKNIGLRESGYSVLGIDLNQAAITEARSHGMVAFRSDVTTIGFPDYLYSSFVFIELNEAVLAEGLLCNLVEDQPKRFMRVSDFYLAPGGFLFIADVLRPGEDTGFLTNNLPQGRADSLVSSWERRYQENAKLGLPFGTFVVARPGPGKSREWGAVDELQALTASADFERFARHYTKEEIRALATSVGFTERLFASTIFYSRLGEPLLGCLAVFQKGDRFVYTPGFKGMTRAERMNVAPRYYEWRDWMKKHHGKSYFEWWLENLKLNLPDWEEIFPQLKDFEV